MPGAKTGVRYNPWPYLDAMDFSGQLTKPFAPPWRHRLISRYCRAGEHPGKLRFLHWLKLILFVRRVRVETTPGVIMELDDRDFVQREILFHGGYELATLARFDALLREARGFVDFGAHMGQFTLRAARALRSRGGRVFAVEPTPDHSATLLRNAALSGLTNIEICTAAFSDASALLRMIAPHPANTGGSRLASESDPTDLRAIRLHVPVRPASELPTVIPPNCLDLVKIDVEGHEFRILRSLFSTAPRLPRDIIFEYNPQEFDYGPTAATVEWLRSVGYMLRSIDGESYSSYRPLPEGNLWAHRES